MGCYLPVMWYVHFSSPLQQQYSFLLYSSVLHLVYTYGSSVNIYIKSESFLRYDTPGGIVQHQSYQRSHVSMNNGGDIYMRNYDF